LTLLFDDSMISLNKAANYTNAIDRTIG